MPRTLTGVACKLYRNTASNGDGSPNEALPVWSEVAIVGDVSLQISGQTVDVTIRKHGKVRREEVALDEISISFDLKVPVDKLSSVDYVAFRDARINHTPMELALTNQPISETGTEVFRCVCEITEMTDEQPLADAVKISVTAKATDSVNPPRYEETP